jgi:Leucine-rich repeat (LRR) protein
MCKVYLIILLFGVFFVRELTANGLICKNDPERFIQNQKTYNIENCTNTEIDLGGESATSLTSVKARNNRISEISDDTFKSAKKMFNIDLRDNKIERISVGAFKDQENLKQLLLKQNKLTRIEVGTFDSLFELKELWLQYNQLTLLEKGLFDQNTNLENLHLHNNKIIAIESTVFAKLNAIKSLTLSWNLCINQDFQSNKFERDFVCYNNYESFKQQLDQIEQCRSENKIIRQEKDQLSKETHLHSTQFTDISPHVVIVLWGILIPLIAFRLSIVKISKLSNENKFLNAKLDKLCEDHVY